jgi:hypothetical protein
MFDVGGWVCWACFCNQPRPMMRRGLLKQLANRTRITSTSNLYGDTIVSSAPNDSEYFHSGWGVVRHVTWVYLVCFSSLDQVAREQTTHVHRASDAVTAPVYC